VSAKTKKVDSAEAKPKAGSSGGKSSGGAAVSKGKVGRVGLCVPASLSEIATLAQEGGKPPKGKVRTRHKSLRV
jgi:hypothetical protein